MGHAFATPYSWSLDKSQISFGVEATSVSRRDRTLLSRNGYGARTHHLILVRVCMFETLQAQNMVGDKRMSYACHMHHDMSLGLCNLLSSHWG